MVTHLCDQGLLSQKPVVLPLGEETARAVLFVSGRMSVEGRAVFAQVWLMERRALWAKQDWEGSLHVHRPGEPAGNTLAVPHRPGGCEGLSRVHTMVSAGCD